ncbi:MSHA biogenesis protein MshP [Sulfuriferula multivorans]|uniref:MSHA biogenesis protein MshP n=2 Tax=Sulfuriferula multivorans TaxID=1559896 RepID=A0A401JAD3_9PROT|nr:MSHA biogenesis protein MshP [Sulfuriferula multivorans]
MYPDRNRSITHATQRGFAIVAAIFLVVVLAALGAFMLTFSSVQHITSAQDVQGTRAYQAARTGIEWGAYQVLISSSCPLSTSLTAGGTQAGFSIVVQCNPFSTTEGGSTVNMYQIISTASQGTVGSATYVERQLQATIGK